MAKIKAMKKNRNRGIKYSESEKSKFILKFKESGLNRHQFALKNGINYFTFLGWLKMEKSVDRRESEVGFKEIKVNTSHDLFAEVDLGNGKCLRFYQAPSLEYLKQIFSL
jgi:hypothetical protein